MINKHIARDGFLFDWKEPRFNEEEKEQEHLYVSVLFLGANDSIENYVEVDQALALDYYK